jgi:hypothetical protein
MKLLDEIDRAGTVVVERALCVHPGGVTAREPREATDMRRPIDSGRCSELAAHWSGSSRCGIFWGGSTICVDVSSSSSSLSCSPGVLRLARQGS